MIRQRPRLRPVAVRYGNQHPTFEAVGEFDSEIGDEAASVFEGWGTTFYPCQRREFEAFMARGDDGEFASKTICICKPRQNGKSYAARKYATWMAAAEGRQVLYSAHNGSTTRKMWKLIHNEVTHNPELMAGVSEIYAQQGAEGIYWEDGGCIEWQTRTTSGARGGTFDIIIIDEAQELTYDQLDAIKPTTIASESGDPQMIYIGTPPGPTCHGTVFRDYHDTAHAGNAGGMWWMEWAVDDIPADISDRKAVMELCYRTNPAMGYRIKEPAMLDAIDSYQRRPDSFAREYLGWWMPTPKAEDDAAIPSAVWDACATDQPTSQDAVAFGVKFSPSGTEIAVAVCVGGKRPRLELAADRPTIYGTRWLRKAIAKHADTPWLVDGKSGVPALVEALDDDAALAVTVASAADATSSASGLLDAMREGAVTVYTDGTDRLGESAKLATRRAIGSAGGWGFGGDSAPIEAAALALHAYRSGMAKQEDMGAYF